MFVDSSGNWWLNTVDSAVEWELWYKAPLRETDRTARFSAG